MRRSRTEVQNRGSEQSFLPSQVSKCPNVGQTEGKAELILVAHGPQGEPPIFKAHATAIPVVGGLNRSVLQEALIRVKTKTEAPAKPRLFGYP